MSHVAVDLALGRTGVCWNAGDYDALVCPSNMHGPDRLHWWHSSLRYAYNAFGPNDTVIVEAPFLHPKHPKGAMETCKLHGVAELLAAELGMLWHVIEPASLKLWAAGNGRANKAEMCQAARAKGWVGTDHNEADSYLIWHWYATTGGMT